ncbi:MAG: histidine kinase [Candidatus Pseudobacter hemicellulosilyticus]|uniref:Histidine kinase n=1 Tax=Candidatus Pseudobacter hemicellulosilyticus TaxID=3121375 RepID=A0AAJ5WRD3_9BACT|nr:MAG: histidine kinase [Pseudobacter sp.]
MEGASSLDIHLFLFAGTGLLLLLALAFVGFSFLYRKRLQRQQLASTSQQQQLREDLLHSNIQALETERKRFAEDLHDDIGSKLSALRLNLAQLQQQGRPATHWQQQVENSKTIIDATISTVRQLSHNLLPPSLQLFGLSSAVAELAAWVNSSEAIRVELEDGLEDIPLDCTQQLTLYRIFQELFSNTIRHAQATAISIRVWQEGVEWRLQYADNGRGLPGNLSRQGLGLQNIEERVSLLKGSVSYPEGQGFCCLIQFIP